MSDIKLDPKSQAYADRLFPCEKPCSSWGVCDNCSERLLFRVGYNMAIKSKNSGFWGRTAARLNGKVKRAMEILDLIERGRFQNGDKLSKIGMRSLASSCLAELDFEATADQDKIGREPLTDE